MAEKVEEKSVRMHIFVNNKTREVLNALHDRLGMPKAELTRRAMQFAVLHMTDKDWQIQPTSMKLARGPGNPHNGNKR